MLIIIGLIHKDLIIIKRNLKSVQVIVLFVVIIPLSQNPEYILPLLSMLITIIFVMQLSTSFELDENSFWNEQIDLLPLLRKSVALSKYLLGGILTTFALLANIILSFIMKVLQPEITHRQIFYCIAASVFLSIIYIVVTIPCIYKFGITSSRILLYCAVFLPSLIGMILNHLNIKFNLNNFSKPTSLAAIVFLLILLTFLSYLCSAKIYTKKEL